MTHTSGRYGETAWHAHLADGHCILLCLKWIVDGGDAMQEGLPILTHKANLAQAKTVLEQLRRCTASWLIPHTKQVWTRDGSGANRWMLCLYAVLGTQCMHMQDTVPGQSRLGQIQSFHLHASSRCCEPAPSAKPSPESQCVQRMLLVTFLHNQ